METIQKIINVRPDSFSISINAKGQWSGEIKVYADSIDEAMKTALSKAKELDQIIKERNKGDV